MMNRDRQIKKRALMLVAAVLTLTTAARLMWADTGSCGAMLTLPFTDVPSNNGFFCAIAEAFFTWLTNGTSPTAYSPVRRSPANRWRPLLPAQRIRP